MDVRRVRVWEWLTGGAGAALLVSLFLPWYGNGGATATGWESLTVIDVILALAALGAIAVPAVAATQRTAAVPQTLTTLLVPLLLAAAVLALVRLANLPNFPGDTTREAGVWIAAVAAIAAFVLDWRAMRDTHFPKAIRPRVDVATVPAPTADGERRDLSS